MLVRVPDVPKVAGVWMQPVQKSGCLKPDQSDYSVAELAEGNRCLQEHVEEVEEQLKGLQSAVRRREKVLGDLSKSKPAK